MEQILAESDFISNGLYLMSINRFKMIERDHKYIYINSEFIFSASLKNNSLTIRISYDNTSVIQEFIKLYHIPDYGFKIRYNSEHNESLWDIMKYFKPFEIDVSSLNRFTYFPTTLSMVSNLRELEVSHVAINCTTIDGKSIMKINSMEYDIAKIDGFTPPYNMDFIITRTSVSQKVGDEYVAYPRDCDERYIIAKLLAKPITNMKSAHK